MTFVAINVLSVPEGAGATLEQRFAGRAGMVEQAPGFVSFELMRPTAGTADYLVLTRWQDEDSYQAWLGSRAFGAGHGGGAGTGAGGGRPGAGDSAPAASGSQIWTFEVVQQAGS